MHSFTVYTSNPADRGLLGLALALEQNYHRPVHLRPLTELRQPDVLRLQQKRVERGDLLDAIEAVETRLGLYASGALPSEAGKQQGLQFTLQSLKSRLKGVNAVLSTVQIGGVDNA